ncbi:MAG: DUF1127 domain-containing protein [Hyphomicrobiales bacterium]|nr:DUF1127 domain-containing protein [Nitratireductor sp.]MCC2095483.1 DUF1127 domain-containing protein [Hyphomicrobiales bacterium]
MTIHDGYTHPINRHLANTRTVPHEGILAIAARAWHVLTEGYRRRRQARINRAAAHNLLRLDGRMLNDIGLTRDDVEQVLGLPIEINAARELDRLRLANRRRSLNRQ